MNKTLVHKQLVWEQALKHFAENLAEKIGCHALAETALHDKPRKQ